MRKAGIIFLALVVLVLGGYAVKDSEAAILRVAWDAPGPEYDGSSWVSAFLTIQEAVNAAVEGDEVWVKAGTYTNIGQCSFSNNYGNVVSIDKTLAVYGGFAGVETERQQRNWTVNKTIVDANNRFRCFLIMAADVTIDGFTVQNGTGDEFCNGGPAGGIWFWESGGIVANCDLIGNSGHSGGGGAYFGTVVGKDLTVTDCRFYDNRAEAGGGIYVSGTGSITNCIFDSNTSGLWAGGGIALGNGSVTNCIFINNAAHNGWGGGIAISGSPNITNCLFVGNHSSYEGNAIAVWGGSPVITNCSFSGNSSDSALPTSSIYITGDASPTIVNSILWKGSAPLGPLILLYRDATVTVTYSDVQGGWPGEGNIDADPLFADPGNGDFHLQWDSPCIDAGTKNVSSLPLTDFEGDPRVIGLAPDMGADEFVLPYIELNIDIKPGSEPNCFNQNERGVIPVAILGSAGLDVSQINVGTLSLQGLVVKMAGKSHRYLAHIGNVNADKYPDLVVQFQDSDSWIAGGNGTATLTGELLNGTPIQGSDSICIVP